MRIPVIATSLTLLAFAATPAVAAATHDQAAGDAAAAPAPPPPGPPRAFQAAGYSQPDITPGLCQIVGPKESRCVIPEMTAGRYLIVAAGTSTAAGDGAAQALEIRLDGGGEEQLCARAQSQTPKDGKPWTEGQRTISVGCMVQVVSDGRITVRALYGDAHATTDSKGPVLALRRMAWNPISNAIAVPVQLQPKAPPAK